MSAVVLVQASSPVLATMGMMRLNPGPGPHIGVAPPRPVRLSVPQHFSLPLPSSAFLLPRRMSKLAGLALLADRKSWMASAAGQRSQPDCVGAGRFRARSTSPPVRSPRDTMLPAPSRGSPLPQRRGRGSARVSLIMTDRAMHTGGHPRPPGSWPRTSFRNVKLICCAYQRRMWDRSIESNYVPINCRCNGVVEI